MQILSSGESWFRQKVAMMYLILSASPNIDGLTAACANAALAGFQQAGTEATHINLCTLELERCRQCGNGWGSCLHEHVCIENDDIALLQQQLAAAQGLVLVTPVYYGEMAESMKSIFDRLRRCETTRGTEGILAGKPVISVAAAGGSGGGITSCLASMERLTQHMRAQVQDLIGITQKSRAYQVETIRAAAQTLGHA